MLFLGSLSFLIIFMILLIFLNTIKKPFKIFNLLLIFFNKYEFFLFKIKYLCFKKFFKTSIKGMTRGCCLSFNIFMFRKNLVLKSV